MEILKKGVLRADLYIHLEARWRAVGKGCVALQGLRSGGERKKEDAMGQHLKGERR